MTNVLRLIGDLNAPVRPKRQRLKPRRLRRQEERDRIKVSKFAQKKNG